MSELKLVGLHDDGEHVVLEGPDGQRFRLPIDEALRAAVRRNRPHLEQVRAELTGVVPPREIQARIRAGATAAELAEETGMPIERVQRYEGPVLAEREFIATQARSTRIGRDAGAPVLGDLVTDRLATRGVQAASIGWDASRGGAGPWTVEVRFVVGETERSARWSFDAAARVLVAVDDEARWLSETELADEPIPRRHLSAVRSDVFDVEVDAALGPLLASVDVPAEPEPTPEPDEATSTQALLDDLTGRRGRRQPAEPDGDDDDGFEGFGPQHTFDFENPELTGAGTVPGAHPPASRPDQATDAQVLSMPALPARHDHDHDHDTDPTQDPAASETAGRATGGGDADPDAPAAQDGSAPPRTDSATRTGSGTPDAPAASGRGRSRKGRASVPSWDEIVFGAKPE